MAEDCSEMWDRLDELKVDWRDIPDYDKFIFSEWVLVIEDLGHTRQISMHPPDRPIKLH